MNRTILIVDPSSTVQKILKVALGREDFPVILLDNGQALAHWLHSPAYAPPALIFLDIRLPDTNGYTLIRLIRRLPRLRETPIIVLTGRASTLVRLRAFITGATAFLTKPFHIKDIINLTHYFVTGQQTLNVGSPVHLFSLPSLLPERATTSAQRERIR